MKGGSLIISLFFISLLVISGCEPPMSKNPTGPDMAAIYLFTLHHQDYENPFSDQYYSGDYEEYMNRESVGVPTNIQGRLGNIGTEGVGGVGWTVKDDGVIIYDSTFHEGWEDDVLIEQWPPSEVFDIFTNFEYTFDSTGMHSLELAIFSESEEVSISNNVINIPVEVYDLGVLGCRDPNACNYSPDFEIDDGSCEYAEVGYDCEGIPLFCTDSSDCVFPHYCYFDDFTCGGDTTVQGECMEMTTICTEEWAPVCGCDGITYGNFCEAQEVGMNVEYEGTCLEGDCGIVIDESKNNAYNTVMVGNQCWMAENLKTKQYNDGTDIDYVITNDDWEAYADSDSPAYSEVDGSSDNFETYGLLYNSFAAMDERGICPISFRVPSEDDWKELVSYLGGDPVCESGGSSCVWDETVGGMLKEEGLSHWMSPNTGATNQVGFTALSAGTRIAEYAGYNGEFFGFGAFSYFWSLKPISPWQSQAYHIILRYNTADITHYLYPGGFGNSVRCVCEYIDCAGVCGGDAVEEDDGECVPPVYGCTHPTACNEDPNATVDDGSCEYLGDLNGDESFNVLDVVALVECVLNQCNTCSADLNEDGIYNVLDIVVLVHIVLD